MLKYLFHRKEIFNSEIGYLTIVIHLSGEGFDPSKLIDKIDYPCKIIQNIGDKIKRGKNKGEIATDGWCSYELDDTIEYGSKISKAVEIYLKAKSINNELKLNIDWFHFSLLFTGCQGNMEFSKEEISELAKLDDGIAMTYVSASDIDYKKQKKLFRIKQK